MTRPPRVKPEGRHPGPDHMRFKPEGYEDWMTVQELADYCKRHVSRVRHCAREAELGDISAFPIAKRFQLGRLSVRLYSPRMAKEAKAIFDGKKVKR